MQPRKWYRIANYIYTTIRWKDRLWKMLDVDNTAISNWETLVWNTITKKFEWWFPLATEWTPANSTATWVKWTVLYDANYLYVCVATNTWVRFAKSAW